MEPINYTFGIMSNKHVGYRKNMFTAYADKKRVSKQPI